MDIVNKIGKAAAKLTAPLDPAKTAPPKQLINNIAQKAAKVTPLGGDLTKSRPSKAADTPYWTTNQGAPVYNNTNSLTVGARGPVLIEDYNLVEKNAQLNRERIPERVVHARGTSAKGYFEVTHNISHLSSADLFQSVGEQTPLITRFSHVTLERGSPENMRDTRGFAVKFYTREGNWDLVGNNIPVFFIRDGIQFPDMARALSPNPRTHLKEDWRIADFFSYHPESMHMFMYLHDDVGIPADYRHMPGYGVHTFKLVNKEGKETFVKFHWIPKCGEKNFETEEEAAKAPYAHATRDLIEAIDAEDYPEWQLSIQTMELEDEDKFDFDPLDATKIWPVEMFPLQPVGKMVLNQNIDNFFAENESLAFAPSTIVPGIQFSQDKMLQSRLFSYADAQRYRLGVNYTLLPVNAPKCPFHNNHIDGAMNFTERFEEVNYFPSRFDPVVEAEKYPAFSTNHVSGQRQQVMIPKENNFKQAGDRFRSFDAARQGRFVDRTAGMLSHPRVTQEIKDIWVDFLTQCDAQLGASISAKLQASQNGSAAPQPAEVSV